MNRTRSIPNGLKPVVAAAVLLLAALAACDAGQVAEPEASLEIVPDSVTLTHVGERFTFTVRGGAAAEAGEVRWSSLDTAVFKVDANGTVTARGNGVSYVHASNSKSADNALVQVRQVVAALEAIGAGQRAAPGLPLLQPVGVRVLDAGGTPVSGAAVRFEPGPGSGRVEPREVYSDSAGVAVVEWTLAPAPGRQTLVAVSAEGGASVEIAATALEPDLVVEAVEIRSGEDQWAPGGRELPDPVVVQVLDAEGRGVRGATVRFEAEAGSGRAEPGVAATDSLGLASAVWTLGSALGTQRLVATAAGRATVMLEATAVSDDGVCNRAPAVIEGILEILADVTVAGCAEVTEEHLKRVDYLYLVDRGIRRLQSGDFAGLPNLRELLLHLNRLTELPEGIFRGLPELEYLSLTGNRLTELPEGIFRGLPDLEYLSLADNRLTKLPPGIFRGLPDLVWLHLSLNQLRELPPGIFAGLPRLDRLSLHQNQLEELPPGIFVGLPRLDRLSLHQNRLTKLPPGIFAGLSSLRSLALNDNRLTELPPGVFEDLSSLDGLNLKENAFESLPLDAFAGLSQLGVLNLNKNRLTALPPGVFDATPRLRWLDVAHNELTRVPAGVLGGLSELTLLDLSLNRIEELSPRAFEGLSGLEELRLNQNLLKALPRGLFAGLSSLQYVRLDIRGDPFPVLAELDRADTSDLLAPGPARVVLRVPGGAPYAFRIPVSVQRGTGSGGFLAVEAGDTVGGAVVVTPAGGEARAVHVSLGTPPGPPAGFEALRVAPGEPVALFAASNNRTPVVRSVIPAHRLQAGGPAAELALAEYFGDSDGDSLVYEAVSGDPDVASGRIEGGTTLWLEPGAPDTTEVVVTATDPGGLRAVQRFQTWVVPAPDPEAFNIEPIFGPGFTEEAKGEIRRAADRWMEAVTGDLPDVPADVQSPSAVCLNRAPAPRLVGVVDDLVIYMHMRLGERDVVGSAYKCTIRQESGLAIYGANWFSGVYLSDHYPYTFYETALHEIGHVLGIAYWRGLLRARDTDPHFAGPLAVAAFNAAGGEGYLGGKVPVEDQPSLTGPPSSSHWRRSVIPGDVMALGVGNNLLTAITLQALADLGHEVDVSKADPYTLPAQAQGDLVAGVAVGDEAEAGEVLFDDVVRGPVVVVDRDGKVVRVIRN